jgi:DNA-directed RNA polymerase specialized sigma24 family protein
MSSFVFLLSPDEIEKFSQDSVVGREGIIEVDFCPEYSAKVREVMGKLPEREADMLDLYFFKKKYQADVGKIFGVSQGDVSYRIKRAIKRIKFLLAYPEIDTDLMIKDLALIMPKEDLKKPSKKKKKTPLKSSKNKTPIPVNDELGKCMKKCKSSLYLQIMLGMYKTSSQSVVAERLGIYQGRVRYRFIKGLDILRKEAETNPDYEKYVTAFEMVAKNPNILRELKVQDRWRSKFQDAIL